MTEQDRVNQEQETQELPQNYHVSERRIKAAFIDFIPLVGLFAATVFALLDYPATPTDRLVFFIIFFSFFSFFAWGYYVILEDITSTTLGKMIMGLKVVKLNGRRYGWGSVILRNTLRVVDGLPFLYLIGISLWV